MDSKELNEILECSVCLERLDHTSKVLPCQHTFCKRCLVEIQSVRKELRCPECRVLVEEDIDDLLPNILLVRILEGLNRKKPIPEHECSVKQKLPKEPCAKVLYDYEPKETGDLALAKGDFVVLVRQVDENWYEGQVKGSQGFLPANYVEVINPLPCLDDSYNDPVAKALYDFDEVQEDDVLTFKQGDIISVARRVDENWCEGKLGNKCGIFPTNFVEFNSVAKAIIESLELSNNSNEEVSPETSPATSSTSSTNQKSVSAVVPHPKPVRKSKILNRDKVPKRHTIHGVEEREQNSNIARVPSRHSVEITSSERLEEAYGENSTTRTGNRSSQVAIATAGKPTRSPTERTTVGGDLIDLNCQRRQSTNEVSQASFNLPLQNQVEQNVSQSSGQSRPNSAEIGKELYIALYNYRAQKEDEMELKAGESYCVIEKCKDGWFKGFSLSNQKRGVFPGNYVRLASIHNLLTKSRNSSSSSSSSSGQAPLPSPRQYPRPVNNGTATRPHYHRSESAPDFNGRPNVNRESLVVDIGNNDEVHGLGAVQNNTITRPLLPPPPEAKTAGFWKKLKPKKKERSRPPPPLPPPPPYTRDVPNGHTQVSMLSSTSRSIPDTAPPPYSSQLPPRQVLRQALRPHHQRQENVLPRERFRAIIPYPPQSEAELELRVGDIVYVSKKRQDGWYKGTLERNGKTGLFPGCFSEKF